MFMLPKVAYMLDNRKQTTGGGEQPGNCSCVASSARELGTQLNNMTEVPANPPASAIKKKLEQQAAEANHKVHFASSSAVCDVIFFRDTAKVRRRKLGLFQEILAVVTAYQSIITSHYSHK